MSPGKNRLFISDKLSQDALDFLEGHPEIEVDYRPGLSVASSTKSCAMPEP